MLSSVHYTVIDAFTNQVFRGNPAAVIILDESSYNSLTSDGDITLRLIAREFNLSETAFVTPKESRGSGIPTFNLRWFTPKDEVPICGHATLASAHALFSTSSFVPSDTSTLHFETLSGTLTAKRVKGSKIELEFPAGIAKEVDDALYQKTKRVVNVAFGGKQHNVAFVGVGEGASFKKYMLIELQAPFDLERATINPGPLVHT